MHSLCVPWFLCSLHVKRFMKKRIVFFKRKKEARATINIVSTPFPSLMIDQVKTSNLLWFKSLMWSPVWCVQFSAASGADTLYLSFNLDFHPVQVLGRSDMHPCHEARGGSSSSW